MFSKSDWQVFFDWVFGYDLFISFSRIDWDERYAVNLAEELSRPPFEFKCFVDAKSMETDRSWKIQGRRALKKSSKVLLLLTPGILRSSGVREELEYNNELGRGRRPITLINIQNAWEKHVSMDCEFTALLSSPQNPVADVVRIDEEDSGKPTLRVLNRIQNDFTLRSENAKRTYILSIVAVILLFLTTAAGVFAELARQQRNAAIDGEKQAQTNQSLLLATLSEEQRARNHPAASLFLALKALPARTWDPERPLVNEAMNALLLSGRIFRWPQTILKYPTGGSHKDDGIRDARFGFDDRQMVTVSWFGRIGFWDSLTGALIAESEQYQQFAPAALSSSAPLFAVSRGSLLPSQVDIWDISQGKIIHRLATSNETVRIAFGDLDRIVTVGRDGTVQIWNSATGLEVTRLERKLGTNLAVAFAREGQLVTISGEGLVQTWSTKDGGILSSFDTGLEYVDRAELSSKGGLAVLLHAKDAASYKIDKIRKNENEPWSENKSCSPCVSDAWNLGTNKLIGTVSQHPNPIFPLIAISPTLDTVAVLDPAGNQSTVLLWSVASAKVYATLQGHQSTITKIAFSRDGQAIGTSSWDRTARVWTVSNGSEMSALRGHTDNVYSVAFDGSGARVLTASGDKTARQWELRDTATIADLAHPSPPLSALGFSADGRFFAAAGGRLREQKSSDLIASMPFFHLFSERMECDGECFVRVWNTTNWQLAYDLKNNDGVPNLLVFSPNSKLLLTAPIQTTNYFSAQTNSQESEIECYACAATAWNLETGEVQYRVSVPKGVISDMKFSADSGLIAISTDSGSTYVFDAKSGRTVADFGNMASVGGRSEPTKSIAFDPFGQRLLGASWDRNVYLSNILTKGTIRTFKGHQDKVGYVQFDAAGRRFLSASADKTARLWNIESSEPISTFLGHSKEVNQAIFAANGKFVATASSDNSIGVWRTEDNLRGHFLRGHSDTGPFSGVQEIRALQGNGLFSFGTDGAARLWDLSLSVALDVLTPPDRMTTHVAVNSSENQLAVARRDGHVQIRLINITDPLQQIDAYSATLYPVLDSDVASLAGIDPATLQVENLERRAETIKERSQAFDAIRVDQKVLANNKLEEFADNGAAAAHATLAIHHEGHPEQKDAMALAFFHHRVAERLFHVLGQEEDKNFEAARRVSLGKLLSRDQMSKYWRQAQSWLPIPVEMVENSPFLP